LAHLPILPKQVHASYFQILSMEIPYYHSSFYKYLGHDEYCPNWECIRTHCLMTILFFMWFSQIYVTHILILF